MPSLKLPTFKYNMRDSENQRNATTTPVRQTTFAIALISSAKPFTENIRPRPLIMFNFSVLKFTFLRLNVSPFPTKAWVKRINMIVGMPKLAAPVSMIEKLFQAFVVLADSNSSGCPKLNNIAHVSRIPFEKKPKDPSINNADAPDAKTSISLEI